MSDSTYIDELCEWILPLLIKEADTKITERKRIIKGISVDIYRDLKETYPSPDEDGNPTYSTIRTKIHKLRNSLLLQRNDYIKRLDADIEISSRVERSIKFLIEQLNFQYREFSDVINKLQEARRNRVRKKGNRVLVSSTEALIEAHRTLANCADGIAVKWQDVAFSLALSTGRRSVEIMRTARFTKTDEYTVSFEGYAKQKDRSFIKNGGYYHFEKAPFDIPTLVKADLVVSGLNWLVENGRRVNDSAANNNEEIALRAKVNSRYSKAFTQHFRNKPVWNCLPEYDSLVKQFGLNPSKRNNDYRMSMHTFRAIYLRCSIVNDKTDDYDYLDFASRILGDSGIDAISSYQKYELKADQTTRI